MHKTMKEVNLKQTRLGFIDVRKRIRRESLRVSGMCDEKPCLAHMEQSQAERRYVSKWNRSERNLVLGPQGLDRHVWPVSARQLEG